MVVKWSQEAFCLEKDITEQLCLFIIYYIKHTHTHTHTHTHPLSLSDYLLFPSDFSIYLSSWDHVNIYICNILLLPSIFGTSGRLAECSSIDTLAADSAKEKPSQ